jgi:cytochrome c
MRPKKMEKARGWVDEAKQFYIIAGKRIAFAEFTNPNGMFSEGEMYVFVLNSKGTMLAHGVNERFVGEVFLDLKDADGKYFIKEIVDTANAAGHGWVDYKWYHPKTKQVLTKIVYFEKVDDLIICSGAYLGTNAGVVLPVEPVTERTLTV